MSSYMILSVYEFIYEYVFPWDVDTDAETGGEREARASIRRKKESAPDKSSGIPSVKSVSETVQLPSPATPIAE